MVFINLRYRKKSSGTWNSKLSLNKLYKNVYRFLMTLDEENFGPKQIS